jgi:hypothetical protein
MRSANFRTLAAAALLGAVLPAFSAELVGNSPLASPSGTQADASSGPLSQSFNSLVAGTIESIVWWGYHGQNSTGPSSDDFVVKLNGNQRFGSVLKSTDVNGLARYELQITSTLLSAGVPGSLEIVNDSLDVEWFWQYSNAARETVAFSLQGVPVPEPGSYALMLIGLLAVARAARRANQA